MPKLKVLLLLLVCAIGLSACSSIQHLYDENKDAEASDSDEAGMRTSSGPSKPLVLTPEPPEGTDPNATGRMAAAPGLQPIPKFTDPTDRDLMVMTDKLAGGSVEIYSFDDAPQPYAPSAASRPQPLQGMSSVTEPNVTVFPLADDGPYPGQAPQAVWPNAVLPGSNMTPYPAPSVMAEDTATPGQARIYFRHGSSSLDNDDRRVLNQVSEEAKFAPVSRVSVEGHASKRAGTGDPVKDNILNLKESMNRAFEVSKGMMMNGVPAEKIKTTAWGDTKPPAYVKRDAEAESRRVEVYTGSGY